MEPENIIPFKRRPMRGFVWSDGHEQTQCEERVHIFDSIPGRCQCGENVWEKELPPDLQDVLA